MGTNGPRKWPGIGIGLDRIGNGLARIGMYWPELVVLAYMFFGGKEYLRMDWQWIGT